jgi:thioredoxin reductase (NADPH)
MATQETDVALVGAGPIGIELGVALTRAGIEHIHLEAGQIGATIAWWAPGTRYFSSPERIAISGVPIPSPTQDKATREDYLAYLRAVVQQFDLSIRTNTRVERVRRLDERFELQLAHSGAGVGGPAEMLRAEGEPREATEILRAKRLVLAIGDMHRPQMLNIPGEDLPHVSHYLAEPHTYFGKRVLIVGGKRPRSASTAPAPTSP